MIRRPRSVFVVVLLPVISSLLISCGGADEASAPTSTVAAGAANSAATSTPKAVPTATATPTPTPVPATPTPALGPELVADGSFEADDPDALWDTRQADGQIVRYTTDDQVTGEQSLYLATSLDVQLWPALTQTKRFEAEPNSQYLISMKVRQTFQGPVQVLFRMYDATGSYTNAGAALEFIESPDGWVEISGLVQTVPETVTADVVVQLAKFLRDSLPEPDRLEAYVDDLSVRKMLQ